MTTVSGHKYERRGLLAIDPKAFFEVFFCADAPAENELVGDVSIVDVRGPLEQHAHPWCDSYESIVARVTEACASSARAVVLRFDSPGGDATGCFDAADELKRVSAESGKPLYALVAGDCCSAAYALACATQHITIGSTALVGSIGVLCSRDDYSGMNAQHGLRVALIASGARKADGHPDNPITDSELAATQQLVDSMASVFFELVSRSRPLSVEGVAKLDAKVFHGMQAVSAGLADEVGSLATVLARVASNATGDDNMAGTAYEKARELLEEAASGDDANAAAAKRALAALETPKDDDAPDDDDKKKEEPAPAAAAPAAAASSGVSVEAAYRAALAAQTETHQLRAELRKRDEDNERAALIASRPGLAAEMVDLLKQAPMKLVRETVAKLQPAAPVTLERQPTRGDASGPTGPQLSAEARAELDERMGLVERKPVAVNSDYKLTLGVRRAESAAGAPAAPKQGA